MESTFLQKVSNYFTTEFKQEIALSLDEDVSNVDKALSAIVPVSFVAAAKKAENNKHTNSFIYDVAKSAAVYFPASPDIAKLHNEEAGGKLAGDILGSHHHAVAEAIARYAGIKVSSAGSMILLAVPVVIGSLGIYAQNNNLSPQDLNKFLESEKPEAAREIPDGIKAVGSLYGVPGERFDEKHVANSVEAAPSVKKNRNWVINLVIILVAVALLIYFSRGCDKPPQDMSNPNVDTKNVQM